MITNLLPLLLVGAGVFTAGAPGAGDPYFPADGNGGYDVSHYDLAIGYQPGTGVLTGTATVQAKATQNLSTFDLDLTGLTVRSVAVNGTAAAWSRASSELKVVPARGLSAGTPFSVVVRYDGVPQETEDPFIGPSGFVRTPEGFVVAGEPHGAATWYPVNDHPSDKASYSFHVSVPDGLQAVANGRLTGTTSSGGRTTWNWDAPDPMASYLATVTTGKLELTSYAKDGLRFTNALDQNADVPEAKPRTGGRLLSSGLLTGDTFFRRLTRSVTVPADGGTLGLWVNLDTSESSSFAVEAHTVGEDDWTTLPDRGGNTTTDAGHLCDGTFPFLTHYVTKETDGSCRPSGSTGTWNAASAHDLRPGPPRQFTYDLAKFAGRKVELSLTYVGQPAAGAQDSTRRTGVFVDDLTVSTGAGSTSFENDGNQLDGWTATPAGSSWTSIAAADVPTSGYLIKRLMAREPEFLSFLAGNFGPYPFTDAGAVVTAADLSFALETQTRPTFPLNDATTEDFATSGAIHELAHQWFGDNVSLRRWSDIWLNEGFATYAQWLWDAHDKGITTEQSFAGAYASFDATDPVWSFPVADPGVEALGSRAIYVRGAMALQVLRNRVGDDAFFTILKGWNTSFRAGNATTADFEALAERTSGKDLSDVFDAWLLRPGKPSVVR